MTDKERIRMEKAIEDAMWGFEPNDNGDYEYADMEEMFMEGAKWQKEQMIDKACEFLRSHIDKQLVIYHEFTWRSRDEFIEGFKKAMEK